MRRLAWGLMLAFAFAVPWQYSLDLGKPLGNIARVLGLLLLGSGVLTALQAGKQRSLHPGHWVVLTLLVWFGISWFWSINPDETLGHLRAYVQEMMAAFLVWELTDTEEDLRELLCAFVSGCWVLAAMTLAAFVAASSMGLTRFFPQGQDPNDTARYLDLALPMAALLAVEGKMRVRKVLGLGYLLLGLLAVLLTGSREGLVGAAIGLAGAGYLWMGSRPGRIKAGFIGIALVAAVSFWIVPADTFARLATTPEQILSGDLNQRWNIWESGWQAFVQAPIVGTGAGTFVTAAQLNPEDTAHSTPLVLIVEGGIVALLLVTFLAFVTIRAIGRCLGPARITWGAVFLTLMVCATAATVQENRATWLVLGMIWTASRISLKKPSSVTDDIPLRSQPSLPREIRVQAGIMP